MYLVIMPTGCREGHLGSIAIVVSPAKKPCAYGNKLFAERARAID